MRTGTLALAPHEYEALLRNMTVAELRKHVVREGLGITYLSERPKSELIEIAMREFHAAKSRGA